MAIEKSLINPIPLVSILMPCYNHEAYIISSLDSVASSDYNLIELIFIDDASKDNSFALATKWFKTNSSRFVRTVCIQHKMNQGICSTFNELHKLSLGEYSIFLASDDLLIVNAISKQLNFAINHEVDFVFSDCLLIDESGQSVSSSAIEYFGKNSLNFNKKIFLAADIIFYWGVPWNKFFMKSTLFEKIGPFDESLSYEDRDFIIRVLINGSFAFLWEPTTAYRIRLKNRLTPGLKLDDIMRDFYIADCKNYLKSTGFTKILLGIVVFSYEAKYKELGIKNSIFIKFFAGIAALFKRLVLIIYRAFLR